MEHNHNTISLGFTSQKFSPGIHACQIYSNDDERQESLLKFIVSGLEGNEKTSCFSDKTNKDKIKQFLGNYGIDYSAAVENGDFIYSGTNDAYFQDNCFSPERTLSLIKDYYNSSQENGYTASRIIGEMMPEVQNIEGGNRLLEYEAKVSLLIKECPVTAVCQYDARSFDGGMILDVLKVHPLTIINGSVIKNPFFIKPEVFLKNL